MIKKLFFVMMLLSTYLVASMNLQNASKEDLMSIAGIGAKKAMAIMEYRKTHKINSVSDLLKIKGIGTGIVSNIKNDVKKKNTSKKDSNYMDKAKAKKAKYSKKADEQYKDSKTKAMNKMDSMKSMF